jgi:indolepyruvate ferredoxin oxidoreductase
VSIGTTDGRVVDLAAKYEREEGAVLLTGIQALVRVLCDHRRLDRARGLSTRTFVSGYEGSPSPGWTCRSRGNERCSTDSTARSRPG